MKILFLTQLFPYPPVCGGTIRSCNILRHLGSRHDVTLVSFVRRTPSTDEMEEAESVCRRVRVVPIRRSPAANLKHATLSLISGRPFIVARDGAAEMHRVVRELMNAYSFDLIYVDHLQMAQYVLGRRDCPKVLDEHNVEWKIVERVAKTERLLPKRLFAEIEWRRLRRWELAACEDFDLVFAVTENDRQRLLAGNPRLADVACLPIGVDFDQFRKVELSPDSRDILSTGTMSWPPNADAILYFAKRIYPSVRTRVPDARLVIAGKGPPRNVRRLAKRDSSVQVAGFVEDLSLVASGAAAFIVPLRSGSGLRVKILNAMAMGLPVVSTSVGCEGIGVEPGRHLLVADRPVEFADALVRLLSDFELRKTLGAAGRTFVLQNYDWEGIYSKLDAALDRVASREMRAAGARPRRMASGEIES